RNKLALPFHIFGSPKSVEKTPECGAPSFNGNQRRVEYGDGQRNLVIECEFHGNQSTKTMTDENRVPNTQRVAKPREIFGETVKGIILNRFVAFAMSSKVDRNRAMSDRKMAEQGFHVTMITGPAMNQKNWRSSLSSLIVGQCDAIAGESPH